MTELGLIASIIAVSGSGADPKLASAFYQIADALVRLSRPRSSSYCS